MNINQTTIPTPPATRKRKPLRKAPQRLLPQISGDEWSARVGGPIFCTQCLPRWSGGRRMRRSITPNPMAGNGKEADDHAYDI